MSPPVSRSIFSATSGFGFLRPFMMWLMTSFEIGTKAPNAPAFMPRLLIHPANNACVGKFIVISFLKGNMVSKISHVKWRFFA